MNKKVPYLAAFALCTFGTYAAYTKGADDFRVFHGAWVQVLSGAGASIYNFKETPDRFLYAPGFAFLFSFIGFLSKLQALALWCVFKAAALFYLLKTFIKRFGEVPSFMGLLLVARAVIIDFQYGQVNLLILFFTFYALLGFAQIAEATDFKRTIAWVSFSCVAIAKVFPAPFLILPFLKQAAKRERVAIFLSGATLLFIPALFIGVSENYTLHLNWLSALQQRGLPLDSHNQSFLAFLMRFLTAEEIRVIPWGPQMKIVGHDLLPKTVIRILGIFWFLGVFTAMAWVVRMTLKKAKEPFLFASLLVALSFVPSHLIWKPYFLLGFPLYVWVCSDLIKKRKSKVILVALLLLINFSNVDIIGYRLAGYFEITAMFLWIHLYFCYYGLRSYLFQAS